MNIKYSNNTVQNTNVYNVYVYFIQLIANHTCIKKYTYNCLVLFKNNKSSYLNPYDKHVEITLHQVKNPQYSEDVIFVTFSHYF